MGYYGFVVAYMANSDRVRGAMMVNGWLLDGS